LDRTAYKTFATLEARHWWFRGRRDLYLPLMAGVLARQGVATGQLDVMDMGCGMGGFLEPLTRFGTVTGVELDVEALGFCSERGHGRLVAGRSEGAPFEDACTDLLCLFDVIEHAPDDVPVLTEACRLVRPGGHVVVSVPAYQFLFSNNDRVAHHYRRYTRGRLTNTLRQVGLEVVKATYVNALLGVGIIPAVMLIKAKERMFGVGNPDTTNLTYPVPGPLNGLLYGIFSGERHVLRHVSAPFGHSLFAVAQRPVEGR
jgi:SAM-dependent methyltransferase